jgi:hypothetical protein
MAVATIERTCKVVPDGRLLLSRVETWARSSGRPVRPLHLEVLLQAPRLADALGCVSLPGLDRLAGELAQEIPGSEEWTVHYAVPSPQSLRFGEITADQARIVTERFHYLRSPRSDGHAYGLSADDGSLVAICVLSPLDVPHLQHLLRSRGRSPTRAQVVSRVFVFEGAPKNCISYLLSRCAHEERRHGVTDLVTYVNPNMGFTGVSYRASGWSLLGEEPGTTYRYLDNRYITDRELERRFQRHGDAAYHRMLGEKFAVSIMPLQPLLIFHSALL